MFASLRFLPPEVIALVAVFLAIGADPVLAGPVDINTADAVTLARELKGVGLARAQAIVDYRKKNGPFRSAEELALVKGIGPKAIEKNRADIRVTARSGAPASAVAPAPKSARAP
ncbi:MAG: helix-hairpin-helix domain-containing protein [Steroidobacteraceae bacterium]